MSLKGDILRNISIFSGMQPEDLIKVGEKMQLRTYPAGEILFNEGDPGEELFAVSSGKVSVTVKSPSGEEILLSEAGAGSFFGEMSIIEQAPRSATCRTMEKTTVLSLKAEEFINLLEERPDAAVTIMQHMLSITAERLFKTGTFLSQMVRWGEEAGKRAITDQATGLFNRRFLEDSVEELFRKAKAETHPLSIAMFDLDHFGDINKKYGLEFGDQVIVRISELFKNLFRSQDILVRYGGDEFIFLFPDTGPENALELCNSLCREIKRVVFEEHPELILTCSLGIASFPDHARTLETLKDSADKTLYRAKELGRDRALLAVI